MARARNIKPAFFTHDELGECSPLARLLFIGLWTLADRNGVLKGSPKRIKVQVLPYDDCDPAVLLGELEGHGFIRRYEVDGQPFIFIPKFREHQVISGSEAAGRLPLPPDVTTTEPKPTGNRAATATDWSADGSATEVQPTDNGSPTEVQQEGNGSPTEKDCMTKDKGQRTKDKGQPLAAPPGFVDFWSAYPRKEKRAAAEAVWRKLSPDAALVARIVADVRKRASGAKWLEDGGKFIPHPTTYLNQRRWEDEGIVLPSARASPSDDDDPEYRRKLEETRRVLADAAERRAMAERERAATDTKPEVDPDGF